MQRVSKILSCLIGCYLLLFYAQQTDSSFAAAIYYTSPSPLLNNHRLRFHVPDGWKLAAVKLENPQQGVVSLAISSNGQIQDHSFWDVQGITLLFSSKQHQQQELTLSLGYFKNYHDPEKHFSFQTATGLTGGLDYLEKPTSSHPFSVCLWLSVPIQQSRPLILDRTYGTFLFLQASIKPASLNESLHLLESFAATISIDSKPYPPASWLSGIALPLQTRSVYHCLPSLWLDGREVRVRLPKGWRLVRFAGETAGGGAWETLVPNMILVPEGRSSTRGYLDFSVTVDSLRYELGHDSLSGYPIRTRSGLSGLFAPTDEGYMATLYVGPHLFWMPDQGSMLDINCVVKGALKADVKRVVMSLLAGLEVVPPSVEKRALLSLYNGHLRYLWSSLKATSFLFPYGIQSAQSILLGDLLYGGTHHIGAIFSLAPNGTGFRVLHSFAPLQPDFSNQDGAFPFAPLAQDAHQNLFGTTSTGGPACDGTLFTLAPDGSHFHLLHAFSGPDGALPYAGVLPSKDGWLYGVTEEGGPYGKGVVYRIREDGTGFQVLHSFGGKDGAYPLLVELVEGSGGWLYGVTSGGGVYGNGVVFGVKEDGSGYRVLHEFSAEDGLGRNGDGSHPYGGLVLGLGGWLYGETYGGGGYGMGVVFRVREDGSGYRVLHTFTGGVEGSHALGRLLLWGEKLYGVCSEGGSLGGGCVFVLGVGGEGYRVLHSFGVDREGWTGLGGLVLLGSEWLYGVTEGGGVGGEGVVYRLRADGSGFGVVYDFGKRLGQASQR